MLVFTGKINVVAGSDRTRGRSILHLEFAFAAYHHEVFGGGMPVPGYRTTRGELGENDGWSLGWVSTLCGERHAGRYARKRRELGSSHCRDAGLVLAQRTQP